MIHLVLLSGGSGARLWPLSNNARSKQFLKVLRDDDGRPESMVQRTFRKIMQVMPDADITIATCASQVASIDQQLGKCEIVVEPERRDTAPAIMLSCVFLGLEQGCSEDDTVVVMPIDTYTEDDYYTKISELDSAIKSGAGDIALLGADPSFPSTKYGYIVPEPGDACPARVLRFVEKPEKTLAAELIEQGALWNCGVFAFRLGYLGELARSYCDFETFEELRERYNELPKNSFDYEVVEKAERVVVIPCSVEWKDLGTWNTLTEEMAEPYSGRVIVDEKTCENVHVVNETALPLVTAGLRDAVVVATHDGILVSGKYESAYIKPLVERAMESRPMYERRRWGEYRVLDSGSYPDGKRALTKELVIQGGEQLSCQLHRHRSEVWTIVSGSGEVVLDGETRDVKAGDVVEIPVNTKHALRAIKDVHVIEVQLGDWLVEEDIERFGNYWE